MYRRVIDNEVLTLSASGWTYRSTFVLFDYETESQWYHLPGTSGLTAISGTYADRRLQEFESVHTRWDRWLAQHPDSAAPQIIRAPVRPRRLSIFLVVGLLLLTILSADAGAGAWVLEPGTTYLKIATSLFSTDGEFDHDGRRRPLLQGHPSFAEPSFRDFSLHTYLERGLTARLTGIAGVTVKSLRSSRTVLIGGGLVELPEDRYTHGPAELTVSVRYGLLIDPIVLSVQGGLKLPLGYEEKPSNDGAPLGTGHPNLEMQLMLGRGFGTFYSSIALGYRRRGGRVNDDLLFNLEAGRRAGPLLLKVALDGVRNTAEPPDIYGQTVVSPLPGGGGTLPDIVIGDQHITKVNPAVAYSLSPELALQADLFHTLSGTNTLRGTTYALALVLSTAGE